MEIRPVIPSLRSELALERSEGMTARTPLKPAHGRSYLQTSVQIQKGLTKSSYIIGTIQVAKEQHTVGFLIEEIEMSFELCFATG